MTLVDTDRALQLYRALGTAVAVVVVTLVVARRVMPKVLEAVARACSPEVFLLSVIALCLGTAYLTALAGVSLDDMAEAALAATLGLIVGDIIAADALEVLYRPYAAMIPI